jgi:fatty acid desaturase
MTTDMPAPASGTAQTETVQTETAPTMAAPTQETAQPYMAQGPAISPMPPVKTGPRLGLVIWGLVLAIAGIWTIAASSGLRVDGQLAFIIALAAAGAALVVAAIVAAVKRPKTS